MIQVKRFLEGLKDKGFDVGGIAFKKFISGGYTRDIFCSFIWVSNQIISITVIRRENGYELSIGETTKEKSLGVVSSQREVVSKLKLALGM